MKNLFVDLDGTLARHPDGTPFEVICQPGYATKLPQNGNMVSALRMINESITTHNETCDESERVEIYILATVLDHPTAIQDKETWLSIYCEFIDEEHQLFVPYGFKKAEFVKELFGDLTQHDFLLDDYYEDLAAWAECGGHPIALFNGIDAKSVNYMTDYTCSWLNPMQIERDILNIVIDSAADRLSDAVKALIRQNYGDQDPDEKKLTLCQESACTGHGSEVYERGYADGYKGALTDFVTQLGFTEPV